MSSGIIPYCRALSHAVPSLWPSQVISRLLRRATKASGLACQTFASMHSAITTTVKPPEGYSNGGHGIDMDIEMSGTVGVGRDGGGVDSNGAASAEGVELLQVNCSYTQHGVKSA